MRRAAGALIALILIGCGSTTPAPTPTVPASPTVNVAATATRDTELARIATFSAQLATLTAPTATVMPQLHPTPIPLTPTALPPVSAPIPTTATPTPTGPQVVTVQGGDPLNVRMYADPNATVIALLGAGADAVVIDSNVTGSDGTTKWVHVHVGNRDGYVRAEFVNAPHPSSGPISTPIFVATTAPPTKAPPTATPDPNTPSVRYGVTLSITVYGDLLDNVPPDKYDQNKPGYRFAALDIGIQNIDTVSRSYSALFAGLKTSDDRRYGSYLWIGDDLEPTITGGTLQPGERQRGWLVFEVPKGSPIVRFDYEDFSQRISFSINPP